MIAMLRGVTAGIRAAHIVLDVRGVGYLIAVRNVAAFTLGSSAELHTHLAVRENALDLYGFETLDELHMFEELIKLPKIGPKSAMQILMQADITLLKQAIAEQDAGLLSKMSGIGKKTAEKIVSELKDVFGIDGLLSGNIQGADTDVVDALVALGYAQKDARDAVSSLPRELTDTNERIKEALRRIGTR